MKEGKSGLFVRDGMLVEVVMKISDGYKQMIRSAAIVLRLDDMVDSSLSLFTMAGALIPETANWSIGEYVKRVRQSHIKLGVGAIQVGF